MNIATSTPAAPVAIVRPDATAPIFSVTGPTSILIRAGTIIEGNAFEKDAPVTLPDLVTGGDYAIRIDEGKLLAIACGDAMPADAIGGFHFAPGGNATACAGGDATPAINPCSCWDAGFRPLCPDPRGMALVEQHGMRIWCDIYLLGTDHLAKGTSRHGETIADGVSLPVSTDGNGKTKKLDFATAVAIYAHHGKQLLGAEEFFTAAFGVTERSSARNEPKVTGLDAPRTSRFGIMQATGNMWVWGTDGHPADPRPSVFGGSWINGDSSGSRYANLVYWPDNSFGYISARGRSDHLKLA